MMEKIVQLVRKENTWENAVYPYWVFENVINPETCEHIINLGKDKWMKAKIGGKKDVI